MARTPFGDCVVSTRGGIVENRHLVHLAVVDQSGELLYSMGDPNRFTLIRSAAKPVQTVAILECCATASSSSSSSSVSTGSPAILSTNGADINGGVEFTNAEMALMTASHNSEPAHVDLARSIVVRAGATENDLSCGGHPSISAKITKSWSEIGYTPTKINSNCSGKHSGMIYATSMMNSPISNYPDRDSPIQKTVRSCIEEFTGLQSDQIGWATDGCNLPAPAIPLISLAKMNCRMAACTEDSELPGDTQREGYGDVKESRRRLAGKVWTGMTKEPFYVAGTNRFCTLWMKLGGGQWIGKVGADGCYGIGIRPGPRTKAIGARGCVGLGIKVEDGNQEVLYMAVTEILLQLGLILPDEKEIFKEFHGKKRVNTAGVDIGGWEFDFDLREQVRVRVGSL